MKDNALAILIRSALLSGLTEQGKTAIAVKQGYQPTQQGAESGAALYFHKTTDRRRGAPSRVSKWDEAQSAMVHTETVAMETAYQWNATVPGSPDLAAMTAADLLKLGAAIMQGDTFMGALRAQSVGILAVPSLTNTPILNDRQQWEYVPSFDLTVTHRDVTTWTAPVVQAVEYRINRV